MKIKSSTPGCDSCRKKKKGCDRTYWASFKNFLVPTLSLILLICSIHSHLNYGKDPKHCDGNYISPSYTRLAVSLPSRPELAKRYSLQRHHEKQKKVLGTPVLFLTGNRGNYKQVKSLGGVAFRIWLHEFYSLAPLDLYVVETNEELSAFNPQLLHDQAFYANAAIQAILESYKDEKNVPTHVFIIGHSMGGIVARYMPMMENYKADTIMNIFTLSTPHKEAPVPISRSLTTFYNTLNTYWNVNHATGGSLSNITLLSVAVGTRDTTLDSSLTYLEGISNPELSFHEFSSSVPSLWTSADHEGAVWCDQTLQILSKTIFHIQQLGPEGSRPVIHRVWEILKQFKGARLVNSTIEHIYRSDVLVELSEPNLTIPSLTTGSGIVLIYRFGLPALDLRHLYQFRLISDVENIELFSCEGEENIIQHKCVSLSQDQRDFPIPSASLNFSIIYRHPSSPPSENRKQWIGYSLNMDDRMKEHQFFLIKVPPSSSGFLFADMTKPSNSYHEFTSMLVHLPLFPYRHSLKPKSVLTIIRLPRIKDGILKYKVWVKAFGVLKPSFSPLILQEVMNEKKPVDPDGSVVSIYAPRYGRGNMGLTFHIYIDPDIEGFDFYFGIDYWGSLSVLSGRYRNLVVALVFALTCICLTIPGRYDSMDHILFQKVYLSAFFPLTMVVAIAAYFYTMPYPDMEYVIGDHELVMIWYFTAVSFFCFGVIQGILYYLEVLVMALGFLLARFISPVLSKKIRIAFCLVSFALLLFIPSSVSSVSVLLFSLLVCVAKTSSKMKPSTHQILCLILQMFFVAFQIPHLLQYLNYLQRGVSTIPIPSDFVGGMTQILFFYFVQPLGAAPSRNMTLISWSISVALMVFGWKHTYLVPELATIMMLFMTICVVLEPSRSSSIVGDFTKND